LVRSIALPRWFFAVLGTLCASFAHAEPRAAWVGVWQGTVGKAEVRVCLQSSYEVQGAYYYTRYLGLIPLSVDGKTPKADAATVVLNETAAGRGKGDDGIVWSLHAAADGRSLEGTWRGRAKELPVRLVRMPEPAPPKAGAEEPTPACESDAFNEPRERPGRLRTADAKVPGGATAYRALSLDFGDRHGAEVTSFELLRDDAGARRLNAAMRKALMNEQESVFGCTRSALGQFGSEGEYSARVEPVLVGRHWLVSRSSGSNSCGGAHPNAYTGYQTWNLDEGRPVDPWTWFGPKGAAVKVQGEGDSRYTTVEMSDALKALLAKAWPRDDEGCKEVPEEGGSSWQAYPSPQGMVFMPELPHVIYACTEEVTLPWPQVLPLLSPQGRKAAEAARADLAAQSRSGAPSGK